MIYYYIHPPIPTISGGKTPGTGRGGVGWCDPQGTSQVRDGTWTVSGGGRVRGAAKNKRPPNKSVIGIENREGTRGIGERERKRERGSGGGKYLRRKRGEKVQPPHQCVITV